MAKLRGRRAAYMVLGTRVARLGRGDVRHFTD